MNKDRQTLADRLRASLEEGLDFAKGNCNLATLLVPAGKSYTGPEVAAIRQKHAMSQAQFAKLLAVSVKTLQSWEQGARRPSRPTMRLLQIFDQPEDFRSILIAKERPSAYED